MRHKGATYLGHGHKYRMPQVRCKEPPASVYQRRGPKVDGREGNGPLTWEQVCELRAWNARGMNASACYRKAVELGWPVTHRQTVRNIIDGTQRIWA